MDPAHIAMDPNNAVAAMNAEKLLHDEMVAELIDKTIQLRLEQLHRNISVINDHLHRIRGKPNPYVNEYGDYGCHRSVGVLGSNHRFDIDDVPLRGLYLERDERKLGLAAKGH